MKRRMARLQELYLNELIDLAAYSKEYNEIKGRMQAAEAAKAAESREADLRMLSGLDWAALYSTMNGHEQRELWRSLLSKVFVSKDKAISVELNPDIGGALIHVK